jgi:hypothetical protein
MTPAELCLVFDLQDEEERQQARDVRTFWGRRLTECYALDERHVVLLCRHGVPRWRVWEARRKEWILERILGREAAA